MKKTLAALFLTGTMLIGGCTVNKIPTPTDNTYPAFVQKATNETKTTATITTSGVLVAVNPKDRVKVATQANQIAKQVKEILAGDGVGLDELRALAVDLVSQENDNGTAGLLVNSIVTVVESNLNINFANVQGDERVKLIKQLANAAADSVITTTQPFVN